MLFLFCVLCALLLFSFGVGVGAKSVSISLTGRSVGIASMAFAGDVNETGA